MAINTLEARFGRMSVREEDSEKQKLKVRYQVTTILGLTWSTLHIFTKAIIPIFLTMLFKAFSSL